MLSVVFLHNASGNLRTNTGSTVWHLSNILTSFMGASVPLFFMISGALLLGSPKTLDLGYTLKKRVPRVLVPFVVWSLIYVAYYLAVSWTSDGAADLSDAVVRVKNFASRPTAVHLWFMYALIPLYFLSPLIKRMTDALDRRLVVYLAVIWVFFSSLLPTLAVFLPGAYRPAVVLGSSYNLIFLGGFAGYFIFGHYLAKATWRVPKKVLAGVILADAAVITLGTWWTTYSTGYYTEAYKDYMGVFVLVLTVAVFLLCKDLMAGRMLGRKAGAVLRFMAPLLFGVYLMHILVIERLSRSLRWWPAESVWMVFASFTIVLGICLLCVSVIRFIKPLCYALTGQRYEGRGRGR